MNFIFGHWLIVISFLWKEEEMMMRTFFVVKEGTFLEGEKEKDSEPFV